MSNERDNMGADASSSKNTQPAVEQVSIPGFVEKLHRTVEFFGEPPPPLLVDSLGYVTARLAVGELPSLYRLTDKEFADEYRSVSLPQDYRLRSAEDAPRTMMRYPADADGIAFEIGIGKDMSVKQMRIEQTGREGGKWHRTAVVFSHGMSDHSRYTFPGVTTSATEHPQTPPLVTTILHTTKPREGRNPAEINLGTFGGNGADNLRSTLLYLRTLRSDEFSYATCRPTVPNDQIPGLRPLLQPGSLSKKIWNIPGIAAAYDASLGNRGF